ncbi:ArsR/SmtB family transcription factor [Streptomyces sp. NRRL B-1347]|uniref:ArsR/SmtB family transcription factor n=1 Tax=Streptomyces sp. NRRL B-1347 TaxID=1476877 RepID=UPI0004C7790B|nr:winged helix-turn-helix domain-containing protein [Streptomyces sp. NRRL B-1347]
MIHAHLDAESVGRVRFAPSPANEAVWWLRYAVTGGRHPVFGDPGAAARWALRRPDVRLVAQCLSVPGGPTYMPDLLTPKPAVGPAGRTFAEQVQAVGGTSPEEAAFQVCEMRFRNGPVPGDVLDAVESGTFAERAANGLREFWQDAVADGWSGLKSVLDADVAARSVELATYGVGHVLKTLHADVTWADGRLTVRKNYEETVHFHGAEVVLSPMAASWPQVSVQLGEPGNAVLGYPATGIGTAADRPRRPAVARLLGRSRAALLGDLAAPRTTGELAARHRLAPATVSYHLGVLHRSGLVLRERDRNVVRYRRSAEGDALLGG